MLEARMSALVCRVRGVLCAVPLEHVEETTRPLPVELIAGVPSFVQGVAVVRGILTPVVDAAALLNGGSSRATRFVMVKAGTRRVALAVDEVLRVSDIPLSSVGDLPPLFQDAGLDAIAAVGALDSDLLFVLRNTRLVDDEVWTAIRKAAIGA